MMRETSRLFPLFVFVLTVLASCNHSVNNSSSYGEIPAKGWAYGHVVALPLHTRDSVVEGELSLAVDYGNEYLYKNMWLEAAYSVKNDDGATVIRRDTLQFILYDSLGNRTGAGSASNFQLERSLGKVRIKTGNPVEIRHVMRTDTLRNVNRVGVFFTSDK